MVGGIITTRSTWRWVFWFNIPIAGFVLVLLFVFCPDFKYQQRISWKQFDLVGCIIYLSACVLLITGLQEAGSGSIKWDSAAFIVCMVLAGLAFVGFGFWIAYYDNPIFPPGLLTRRILFSTIM